MAELRVPQALLEYLVGHPESSLPDNRGQALALYLDNLVTVHSHPVDSRLRRAVEAKWAEITLRQMYRPAFCQDLEVAIQILKEGRIRNTRKRCLAEAFLLMHTYRDWWLEPQESELLHSHGLPLKLACDPPGLDFSNRIILLRPAPNAVDFLRRLKSTYHNQINTYTVRLFAKYLWLQGNHRQCDSLDLPLNDEPTRTQWLRWCDELGLDDKVLPRSTGGRGK